jgi:tetratricopeptide (TPR) repeat protein
VEKRSLNLQKKVLSSIGVQAVLLLFATGAAYAYDADWQTRLNEGDALLRAGKSKEASSKYQEALDLCPDNPCPARGWCEYHLALSAEKNKERERAATLYADALKHAEGSPDERMIELLDHYALFLRANHQTAKASPLEQRLDAMRKSKDNSDQWFETVERAKKAARDGNLPEAERFYRAALSLAQKDTQNNSRYTNTLYPLAKVLDDAKKYSDEEALFNSALAKDKSDQPQSGALVADDFADIAAARFKQKNFAGANVAYDRAIEIRRKLFGSQSPNVARLLLRQALVLDALHRREESAKLKAEAGKILPVCKHCNSNFDVVPMHYGISSPLVESLRGDIISAGCAVEPEKWHCNNCNRTF